MPNEDNPVRRLIAAYTVNQLGSWFGTVALAVAVYDRTHSAIATTGLFLAAQLLPALLSPLLVIRVEMTGRRTALAVLFTAEAVCTCLLAALVWRFALPAVLVLVAVDGTAALGAGALLRAAAARAGADREMTRSERTAEAANLGARKANAALNAAFAPTVVAGPVLGGLLVALVGAPSALIVDACTFLACAALLRPVEAFAPEPDEGSLTARFGRGWRHIREVPQLRRLFLAEAVALVFFGAVTPIEVIFAKLTLHGGTEGYGFLMGSWGVGMVIGGAAFGRAVRRPLGPLITIGAFGVGLAYLGMGAAPSLWVACAAAVIGGAGNGVQIAAVISAVQQLTPDRLQARMMSAIHSVANLCPAVGFILGGAIAALSSPRAAFLIAGTGATSLTLAFLLIAKRGFDGPPRSPVAGDERALPTLQKSSVPRQA